MADNVLRVGAEFDASPIIAGAQQAGAAFDSVKAKLTALAAEFESTGNTTVAQAARFMASGMTADEAASALQNLGTSAKTAAEATAAVGAAAGVAAPELQKVAAAAIAANVGVTGMERAMANATARAAAMAGGLGGLGFAMGRVASSSGALAPILAAAFPIVALAAFVDILINLPDLINKATDALAGWDKEAKTAYEEQLKLNQAMIVENLKLKDEQEKQAQIGVQGEAKKQLELRATQDELRRTAVAQQEQMASINRLTASIADLENEQKNYIKLGAETGDVITATFGYARLKEQIEENKKALADATKLSEEFATKEMELQQRISAARKEASVTARDESRADALAEIEAQKAIGLAREQAATQAAQGMRSIGHATPDQEAELLQGAEQRKYDIERKAMEDTVALLKTEGDTKKAEIARINGEMEAAEIAHNSKMQEIRDKADAEDRKAFQDMARGVEEAFLRSLEEKTKAFEEEKKKEFEDQLKGYEDQVSVAKDASRSLAEADKAAYDARTIGFDTYTQRAIYEAKALYEQEIAILDQETEAIRQQANAHVLTEEEASKRLQSVYTKEAESYQDMEKKIEQEQAAAAAKQEQIIRQITNNMVNEFTHAFEQVLTGHERWAQAMSQVWAKMATNFAENIAKMAAQELIALATHKTVALSEIMIDAKKGAADAYQALAGIPVIGPALGAAAAAATFAAIVAFGSFQQGGVIGAPSGQAVPIIAHGGESVLPEHLTNFLMNAASTTTNNSTRSSVTNNFHQNPTINVHQRGGSMGPGEIVKAVRRGIRMGH